MTHSRNKGARGEREAAKYLTKLGFECERNGRNGYSTDDLRLPGLPNLLVEVKYGVMDMDIGTARLLAAWEQAGGERWAEALLSGDFHKLRKPVVLWKLTRKPWRLTWMEPCGLVTTTGDDAIKSQLLRLNGGKEAG